MIVIFIYLFSIFDVFKKFHKKAFKSCSTHTKEIFGGFFLENLLDFGSKLLFSIQTKTRRVLSGFTVGFGWVRVSFWKSGSGLGLTKIVGCRVLGRVFKTRCITSCELGKQIADYWALVSLDYITTTKLVSKTTNKLFYCDSKTIILTSR